MCPFCQGHISGADRGQYKGIQGEKDLPQDFVNCHISCGRERLSYGMPIIVRWYPPKNS